MRQYIGNTSREHRITTTTMPDNKRRHNKKAIGVET